MIVEAATEQETAHEALFWRSAASIAAQAPRASWSTYSALKGLWQASHPDADHVEHERAMARIAKLVGV